MNTSTPRTSASAKQWSWATLRKVGDASFPSPQNVPSTRPQGEIVPGGADWNLSRRDGATVAEATYFLKADDDVLIRITNTGVGAPPNRLRFTTPIFEAPRGKYKWLNQSVFVATLDVDWNQEHPIRIRVFSLN